MSVTLSFFDPPFDFCAFAGDVGGVGLEGSLVLLDASDHGFDASGWMQCYSWCLLRTYMLSDFRLYLSILLLYFEKLWQDCRLLIKLYSEGLEKNGFWCLD